MIIESRYKRIDNLTIKNCLETAKTFATNHKDRIIPVMALGANHNGLTIMGQNLQMTNSAITHLTDVLNKGSGIRLRTDYLKNIYNKNKGLFSDTINHLLSSLPDQETERNIRVRLNGDTVRAFCSTQYAVLDNVEYIEEFLKLNGDNEIKSFHLSDDMMCMNILDNNNVGNNQIGDIFPMFTLKNSETKHNQMSFVAGLFRLVCTNGMLAPANDSNFSVSRIHRGNNLNEFFEKITENFPSIKAEIQNFATQYMMLTSQNIHIIENDLNKSIENEVKTFNESHNGSISAQKLIDSHYDIITKDRPFSRFNFVNALTNYSQTLGLESKDHIDTLAFKYTLQHIN